MSVLTVVGVAAAAAGSWAVAPLVGMARKGTIDQQTLAGIRQEAAEAERADAVRRAQQRAALVASIPAPRGPLHDQRRTPIAQ